MRAEVATTRLIEGNSPRRSYASVIVRYYFTLAMRDFSPNFSTDEFSHDGMRKELVAAAKICV